MGRRVALDQGSLAFDERSGHESGRVPPRTQVHLQTRHDEIEPLSVARAIAEEKHRTRGAGQHRKRSYQKVESHHERPSRAASRFSSPCPENRGLKIEVC